MVDKKKNKAIPKPVNTPEPTPEPIIAPDEPEDILSLIDEATWKRGFYIRVRKHQTAARGMLLAWQVERIVSSELETETLPDVINDKYGSGVYRLNFYNTDGKRFFADKKIEVAVGDINAQRPSRTTQPNPPGDSARRGQGNAPQDSRAKVEARGDVLDAKARVDIAKSDLELDEIAEKKKALKSGDQNQSVERIVTSMAQSFKDAITSLTSALVKPSGDSDLKKELADLKSELKDMIKGKETANMYQLMSESNNKMFMWMLENSKNMSESQINILKEMMNKNKGNSEVDNFDKFMRIFKTKREIELEDREMYGNFAPDTPPTEVPWYQSVLTTFSGIVEKLSKDGTLNTFLAKMEKPPVQPTEGKVYTEAEMYSVAQRLAEDEVRKQLAALNKDKEPKLISPIETKTPAETKAPVVTQPIPAGETAEEFAAKKEVLNNVLTVLLREMILCPRVPEWPDLAIGKLPDDILIVIRDAKEFTDLFAVLARYADAEIMASLKSKLESDAQTPEKKKLAWLTAMFNALKTAIAELLKTETAQPAPAGEVGTAGGTVAPGVPAGTVT